MSDFLYTLWADLKQSVVFALIGGMGGVVYLIVSSKRLRWTDFVRAFVVAAFAGWVGGTICDLCGLTSKMQWVGSALSGVAGGFGLLWTLIFACRKIGMDLPTVIKEVQSLRQAMDRESDYSQETSRGLLERLMREGRITPQEFSALFCGYADLLEALIRNRRISPAEFEILKAADFMQRPTTACPDEPREKEGKEDGF